MQQTCHTRRRCSWCNLSSPIYVRYHDTEWGVPTHSDRALFELLVLEPFQAGLAWETVLNKRENFRRAMDGFDPAAISRYGEDKVRQLLDDPSIIRNRGKIEAAIQNAAVFLQIQAEWGTFDAYLWHFSGGSVIRETGPTRSPLSDALAKDLKARGMRQIGSTTAYAYLQAVGVIRAHQEGCFLCDAP